MEDGEDTTDGADTTDTPTDTDTVTWENAPLMLNPKPKLPLKLMPLLMLTTDITDTHMLMDMAVTMVDTTDILMDTIILERDLLMLNLKLKPNPKLMPPPGGYYGYPYGYHYLGKRSADAEPEAEAKPEADAAPWYGYYGGYYGYPYRYGYARPYGYYGRYWW